MNTNKDLFFPNVTYPAQLLGIDMVSDDSGYTGVVFRFLVWNGSVFKEFTHTCSKVYTSGMEQFKQHCISMVTNRWYHDRERAAACLCADMNIWIGRIFGVSVDYDSQSCDVSVSGLYKVKFEEDDAANRAEETLTKKITHYLKVFKKHSFEVCHTPVPNKINYYMKTILNISETFIFFPSESTSPKNVIEVLQKNREQIESANFDLILCFDFETQLMKAIDVHNWDGVSKIMGSKKYNLIGFVSLSY